MNKKICCFIGHRKIKVTDNLKEVLYGIIQTLVLQENVDTFFFGSKSQFNDLCYEIVSNIKKKYFFIKRVYVRAQFQNIGSEYTEHLMKYYEDTYYPKKIQFSGKLAYIERNYDMIDKSEICVFYFDKNYQPPVKKGSVSKRQTKSGTLLSYNYAERKKRKIINVFNAI